ncbi:hypothetical protein E3V33_00100 [Candidatus Marinimicrobia bacterium MT.SAG.4]|nr:hypothetical protein E3V33_00100 [Candidatus Marinimicrobia bacterium MT.SAG.4]
MPNPKKTLKHFSSTIISLTNRHRELISNQLYNSIRFILTTLIALLTLKLITTYLSPESYGKYKNVLAIVALFSITTITGFNKSLGGYVVKNFHGTVKKSTIISLKFGIIGVIGLIVFGFYSYIVLNETAFSILYFVAAAVFLPYTIFIRYGGILAGLQRFKELLFYGLTIKITLFLTAVVILIVLNKDIITFGISQLTVSAFLYTLFYFISSRKLKNDNVDQGYLKHSVTLSLIGLGSSIISPGIQIYLNFALGSASLAYFIIAKSLSHQILAVVKPIVQPLSIKLASKDRRNYNLAILKLSPFVIMFGILLYLIYYLAIDNLGPYFISEAYQSSILYAKLLGAQIIISPLYSLLNSNIVFEKKNKVYSISVYGNQLAVLIGYFLLVGEYGIFGVIITNVGSFIIQVIIMMYYLLKDIKKLKI